jgi:hypothetical protein
MRRLLLLLSFAGLLLAGCGSSSSSSGNVTNTELSYFPSGAPLVAMVSTDPNGKPIQDAQAFLGQFPLAKLAIAALETRIAQSGINYARDIKPLLGNPIVLGASSSATLNGRSFLLVLTAEDAGKLAELTSRKPAPQALGSYDGAKLYQSGSYAFGIDGATALLGPSADDVKAALDRHAHGGGISGAQFATAFKGLQQQSLVQVFGNLTGVLATSKNATARRIPWVAAIRSYALTLNLASSGANLSYRVDTSGGTLTAAQLPLASGATPPNVSSQAPLAFGLHDLSHVFSFALAAVQATNPASYADFLKRVAKLKATTGVDLNRDVFAQLSGNLEIDYGPGGVLARAQVADPSAAARTLSKLSTSSREIFKHAKSVKQVGGGFYAIKTASTTIYYGLVGSELVVGTAHPAQLSTFATAPASPVSGAQGPLAFRLSVGELVTLALKVSHKQGSLPPEARSILNMFGDVTGWAANDAGSLHGEISIPLK